MSFTRGQVVIFNIKAQESGIDSVRNAIGQKAEIVEVRANQLRVKFKSMRGNVEEWWIEDKHVMRSYTRTYGAWFSKILSITSANPISNEFFHAADDQVEPEYDFIDLKDDNITFLPVSRKTKNENDWTSRFRQQIRLGRFVKKFLKKEFSDKDIEVFVNLIKATTSTDSNFSIVTGDDIRKYYHESNYAKGGGTLNNSCMRNNNAQSYLDVYTQNPETISLLVLKNTKDQILGRSILWNLGDRKFMDRVYTTDDYLHINFIVWAKANGYCYKMNNHYETPEWIYDENGVGVKWQGKVELKSNFSKFPYMDTFKYKVGNFFYNWLDESLGRVQLLTSTGGTWSMTGRATPEQLEAERREALERQERERAERQERERIEREQRFQLRRQRQLEQMDPQIAEIITQIVDAGLRDYVRTFMTEHQDRYTLSDEFINWITSEGTPLMQMNERNERVIVNTPYDSWEF